MTHRLFTACQGTETNSFSPIPTGLSVFEAAMLVRGGRHGDKPRLFAVPLMLWRERAQALVVKSTQHFHAGFAPIAREILCVSAPGSGAMDMSALQYRHVKRPLGPRVASPVRGVPGAPTPWPS